MIPFSTAAIFAALACLHATRASPLALPQAVDTLPHHTDISEDRKFRTDLLTSSGLNCWITKDPDCWAEMKMDEYVLKWAEGPVARGCGTQGIRESFGDCFIRIHEMGPLCNSIGETNCGTEVKSSTDILRYSELVEGKVPITDLEKRQAWLCATNIVGKLNARFRKYPSANCFACSNQRLLQHLVHCLERRLFAHGSQNHRYHQHRNTSSRSQVTGMESGPRQRTSRRLGICTWYICRNHLALLHSSDHQKPRSSRPSNLDRKL